MNSLDNPKAFGFEVLGHVTQIVKRPDTDFQQLEMLVEDTFKLYWKGLGLDLTQIPIVDFTTRKVVQISVYVEAYRKCSLGVLGAMYHPIDKVMIVTAKVFRGGGPHIAINQLCTMLMVIPNNVKCVIKHEGPIVDLTNQDEKITALFEQRFALQYLYQIDEQVVKNYDYDSGSARESELMKSAEKVFNEFNEYIEQLQFRFCGINLSRLKLRAKF